MTIKVIYHVCAINHWKTIVEDQINKIHYSGLYESCQAVFCFVSGKDASKASQILRESGKKFFIIATRPNDDTYERLALHGMIEHNLVRRGDRVLYIHSKGVTKRKTRDINNVNDWRNLMEYRLIKEWQHCVAKLRNHDLVGTNYSQVPKPHFSGNFWWARGSYLLKLQIPIDSNDYFAPEMWVCGGERGGKLPKIHKIQGSTGINHYHQAYPRIRYVGLQHDIPR